MKGMPDDLAQRKQNILMVQYKDQLQWKSFEERVRKVIVDLMKPMQSQVDRIDKYSNGMHQNVVK